MDQAAQEISFKIWAVDDVVYGPVDLPTLAEWVRDERVLGDTWVFSCHENKWSPAGVMKELRAVFNAVQPGGAGAGATPAPLIAGIKPGALRRVKILGEMTDQQLGRFAQFMEVENVRQFHTVVKQGDPGDSMFLILEGELRVRQMIGSKETVLVTLLAGEFFGDISLFDHGPRSADVVANQNSGMDCKPHIDQCRYFGLATCGAETRSLARDKSPMCLCRSDCGCRDPSTYRPHHQSSRLMWLLSGIGLRPVVPCVR